MSCPCTVSVGTIVKVWEMLGDKVKLVLVTGDCASMDTVYPAPMGFAVNKGWMTMYEYAVVTDAGKSFGSGLIAPGAVGTLTMSTINKK